MCCLFASVVGCGQPQLLREQRQPTDDFAKLLTLNFEQFAAIEDLKLRARVRLRMEGREERAMALLMYVKPDMFRIDVRGPLFSHILTAVTQQDTLILVTPEGSWKGSTDTSLSNLIGIDLSGYDLGMLMLGGVVPAPIDSSVIVEYLRADRVVLPLVQADATRRVTVDLYRGLIIAEQFISARASWHRELEEYRRVGSSLLPGKMSIRQGENHMLLEYGEFRINKGLPIEEFLRGVPEIVQP